MVVDHFPDRRRQIMELDKYQNPTLREGQIVLYLYLPYNFGVRVR